MVSPCAAVSAFIIIHMIIEGCQQLIRKMAANYKRSLKRLLITDRSGRRSQSRVCQGICPGTLAAPLTAALRPMQQRTHGNEARGGRRSRPERRQQPPHRPHRAEEAAGIRAQRGRRGERPGGGRRAAAATRACGGSGRATADRRPGTEPRAGRSQP